MTLERCFNEEYRLTSIDSIRLCTRSLFRWFISWYFEPFVTVFYKKCTALKIPSVPFLFFLFFPFFFFFLSSAFGVPSILSNVSSVCKKRRTRGGNRSFVSIVLFSKYDRDIFPVRTRFLFEVKMVHVHFQIFKDSNFFSFFFYIQK